MPEFEDGAFRLDVEYNEDDNRYHFRVQNPAGQVVRSFTEEKAANGKGYIFIEGLRILYNTEVNCVLAATDSDAQKAAIQYRTPDGHIYYGLDRAKIKYVYSVIEDSPEEAFEVGRLKISRPVTQEDAANITKLSDEDWTDALREFRQLR